MTDQIPLSSLSKSELSYLYFQQIAFIIPIIVTVATLVTTSISVSNHLDKNSQMNHNSLQKKATQFE